MEKKLYIKPETETLHMDSSQLMAASPQNSIEKSDDPNGLETDDDGYYWAD